MPQVQLQTRAAAARERIVLENAIETLFTPPRAYPNLAPPLLQHSRDIIKPLHSDNGESIEVQHAGRASNPVRLILLQPVDQRIVRWGQLYNWPRRSTYH